MKLHKCVVAALLCFTAISADEHCMTSLAKHPFDTEQFSGTWYVVARTKDPHDDHGDLTCAKIDFNEDESHVHIQVTAKTSDGSERTMEGKGEANGASSVLTWKSSGEHVMEANDVHFSILASDYKTYALSHACFEVHDVTGDSTIKIRHDGIWSREPTLDPVVFKTLQSVMSSLDIAEDDWQIVNNSGC